MPDSLTVSLTPRLRWNTKGVDVWLAYAVSSGEDPESVHQDCSAPVTDGTNDRVLQLYGDLQCCGSAKLLCHLTTKYHLSEARYYLLVSWCLHWHNTRGKPAGKTHKNFRVCSLWSLEVERLTCQGQEPLLVSWPLIIRGESGEAAEISRNFRGLGRLKLANSGLSPQSGFYFD